MYTVFLEGLIYRGKIFGGAYTWGGGGGAYFKNFMVLHQHFSSVHCLMPSVLLHHLVTSEMAASLF